MWRASPDFINWRLELVDSGEETGAEGVEREVRGEEPHLARCHGPVKKSCDLA